MSSASPIVAVPFDSLDVLGREVEEEGNSCGPGEGGFDISSEAPL